MEYLLKNKKNVIWMCLLLLAFGDVKGQEKLSAILDSLRITNKVVNIDFEVIQSDNYFDLLAQNKNFGIELDSTVFGFIYLNSYKQYSSYAVVEKSILEDLDDTMISEVVHNSILFDREKELCFAFRHSYPFHFAPHKKNEYSLSLNSKKSVAFVHKLDKNFNPLHRKDVVNNSYRTQDAQIGDILSTYFVKTDSVSKNFEIIKFFDRRFHTSEYPSIPNLYTILYPDFIKFFDIVYTGNKGFLEYIQRSGKYQLKGVFLQGFRFFGYGAEIEEE